MTDRAIVSVLVRVPPEDAFEVFTKEIDLWWKHGPGYRVAGRQRGQLSFEGGLGGRLFETFDARTIEMGKITAWDPPARFAFEWRATNFTKDEATLVEVRFEGSRSGTLVTVEHSGWSKLRPGHPARHGEGDAVVVRRFGLWWGALLSSLREHVLVRIDAR